MLIPLEFKSELVSWKKVQWACARSGAEQGHTFFFGLDDGLEGAQAGSWLRQCLFRHIF
jgi:hypothetical protein